MNSARPWQSIVSRGHLAVLLVRHGQTEWNRTGRFLGITDIPLDETGASQALELSIGLGGDVDRVYSSPLARALGTARALTAHPTVIPGLRELDQGALEGMELPEALARYPAFFRGWAKGPASVSPPDGENLLGCQRRVIAALREVGATHGGGEVIALCSHQLAIASALCELTGSPLARWRDHRLPNCGISVLDFDGTTWKIEEHAWVVGNLGKVTGSSLPDV